MPLFLFHGLKPVEKEQTDTILTAFTHIMRARIKHTLHSL